MAAEKSVDDREQSADLESVSSAMAPKHFVRPMELGIGEESGGNSGTYQPKGSTMHIAEYQHRLHESKRVPHTVAIGAPSSYDARHPSHDIHHAADSTVEPRESKKQGKSDLICHLIFVQCQPSKFNSQQRGLISGLNIQTNTSLFT